MNPNEAPIVWIGLLFSIICLAELSSDVSDLLSSAYHGNSPGEADRQKRHQIELCREMIAQCLFLGEYTKSGPYVLETVIHVVNLEFLIRIDADKDIWFLLAMAVYIAMRMGYHRDPSHFPDISPKQGEIRRRQWATILQGDVLISSQMGMPRMISTWQCDTKEPRNLNDDDLDGLDDAVAEMPPSRPETQLTTSLAVIARRRMVMALGAVEDLTAAVRPSSYAEVMRVDGLLHAALSSVPPPYQSTSASVTDSPQIIITRLFLNHMFYKGQIMLHRKFLCLAPVTQTETGADTISYGYSRKTCLDASLGTLHIQHVLDEETRPGGQLQMVRYRVTSIMNHSFLTATMVLCSFLYRNRLEKQALLQDGEQEKIMAALRRARVIWMRASTHSREAKKAAEAVSLVLARTSPGEDADSWKTKDLVNDVEGAAKPGQSAWPSQPSASSDTTHDGSMGGLYEPEGFNMPNFLGAFMPPVDHFNMTERGSVGLEEWMVMNGPSLGTDWS
ncbi:hypothetical protein B0H63DRAFT_460716 [Podospora didyma]|uniref:Xylanolytic transcriptional activator regulatory domain-containing protein n=1 Tax=Podospora didyma TaxID=330526 RepID=A0AAE0U7Z5_9PEZI|nr:hypothetical protein B0H63DRAFT_460716 [Podospora didyma]